MSYTESPAGVADRIAGCFQEARVYLEDARRLLQSEARDWPTSLAAVREEWAVGQIIDGLAKHEDEWHQLARARRALQDKGVA